MTPASEQALAVLRNPHQFQWYVIPMFACVVYIYSVEIERRNWSLVLAGLTVSAVDWMLELINALVLVVSHRAAIWTEVGPTAYQVFVGVNIETLFMFAVMGIVYGKMLPADKEMRIAGIPNRWFFIVVNSLFCVAIEVILNHMGYLVWEYWWWNFPNIVLIVMFGYGLYFVSSYYVIDVPQMRKKIMVPAVLWSINVVATVILVGTGTI